MRPNTGSRGDRAAQRRMDLELEIAGDPAAAKARVAAFREAEADAEAAVAKFKAAQDEADRKAHAAVIAAEALAERERQLAAEKAAFVAEREAMLGDLAARETALGEGQRQLADAVAANDHRAGELNGVAMKLGADRAQLDSERAEVAANKEALNATIKRLAAAGIRVEA